MTIIVLLSFVIVAGCCFRFWRDYKDMQLLATVTSSYRGERSERATILKLLKMGVDHRAIFHDCYLQKADGTYTQIDLAVATSQGLLVFEIKEFSGWIYGHFRQKYWTQILAYGREKHRFYNPIMQNDGHIQAILDNLPHNQDIPIYSIIVFYGNCRLKDVTVGSDYDYIIYPEEIKHTLNNIISGPAANFGDKYEIMNVFKQGVYNGTIPEIVSSQRLTALKAGQNRPQSSYYRYSYKPFAIIRRILQ